MFIDGDDPLSNAFKAPTSAELEHYITLNPFLDFEFDNSRERNNMMNILLMSALPQYNTPAVDVGLQINIATNAKKWTIADNAIRPLSIANEVVKTIDNLKIHAANRLVLSSIDYFVLNTRVAGYELNFAVVDGVSEITNF